MTPYSIPLSEGSQALLPLATYGGLFVGLLAGVTACLLALAWGLFAVYCACNMRSRQRLDEAWCLTLRTVAHHCGDEFPQVGETARYLHRIATGEAEELDVWQQRLRETHSMPFAPRNREK